MAFRVQQFYDKPLAHFGYAVVSDGEAFVVDPGRDPQPYLDWIQQQGARLVAIFETHPHADFASSHRELHERTGATVYVHPDIQAEFPHHPLNDQEEVPVGTLRVRALYTPGHSPDHHSFLILENGTPRAVFTGDSLFIGDVGRPDLREEAGARTARRTELARMMFQTIHQVFAPLPDDVLVYPAHGKGSLCGRSMRAETVSTIGQEKRTNWAFQVQEEDRFVDLLLANQPFIPPYFPYDVEVNRRGAPWLNPSLEKVPVVETLPDTAFSGGDTWIVDIRPHSAFRKGHIPGSINIPDVENENVETWIGTLLPPGTRFYLVGDSLEDLRRYLYRVAKIHYEPFVAGVHVLKPEEKSQSLPELDPVQLAESARTGQSDVIIVDVRSREEQETRPSPFPNSLNLPLQELPESVNEIPPNRTVVVHCAGGYRSDIAVSVIRRYRNDLKVVSLGNRIQEYWLREEAGAGGATTLSR